MKAYKVFSNDWTCKGFKYVIGETYIIDNLPKICEKGFHACFKLQDCFRYYLLDCNNKFAIVEILGDVVEDGDKICTNILKIVQELSFQEVLNIVNTGDGNTGYSNTGNSNTGDSNTGDRNTGYGNTGYGNTGHRNTGYGNTGNSNTGHRNTGYSNTGDRNTGYSNTGNRNTGDSNTGYSNTGNGNTGNSNTGNRNTGSWNKSNLNTGDWNTEDIQYVKFFNKIISIQKYRKITTSKAYNILDTFILPKYRNFKIPFKSAFKLWWRSLAVKKRLIILKMPYFDSQVFFEITGLRYKGY